MKVVFTQGDDDLARVFVAELGDGSKIEFVESIQPPRPLEEKWVHIVSTLKGCPVGCPICDAGGDYKGKLTRDEILGQIDHMVSRRFKDGVIPARMLKIQFARMGDPAFNDAVLDALETLPSRYEVPVLVPSISTVAPVGRGRFFNRLIGIKNDLYSGGRFQMQFSIHTTDDEARRELIPVRTWGFERIAAFGNDYFSAGDRKITLNFAMVKGYPLSPERLLEVFSPDKFLVKLTPINPTDGVKSAGIESLVNPDDEGECREVVERFTRLGFETILSIGELEENNIGSNCGMYLGHTSR